MRTVLLCLAVLALALGAAGTATAHYLVKVPTPFGTICFVSDERLLEAIRDPDPFSPLTGVVSFGGC